MTVSVLLLLLPFVVCVVIVVGLLVVGGVVVLVVIADLVVRCRFSWCWTYRSYIGEKATKSTSRT